MFLCTFSQQFDIFLQLKVLWMKALAFSLFPISFFPIAFLHPSRPSSQSLSSNAGLSMEGGVQLM